MDFFVILSLTECCTAQERTGICMIISPVNDILTGVFSPGGLLQNKNIKENNKIRFIKARSDYTVYISSRFYLKKQYPGSPPPKSPGGGL